jgi:predicted nucleic acid-binding protein
MTRAGDAVGICPALRAEMYAAVWRDRTRRTRFDQVLARLRGDPEIAEDGRRAGELLGRLDGRQGEVSLVDAMLAAVAERADAIVLTDDTDDFGRLRDESGWTGAFRTLRGPGSSLACVRRNAVS